MPVPLWTDLSFESAVDRLPIRERPKPLKSHKLPLTYLPKYRHFLGILALTCSCGFSGFCGLITCNNEDLGSKIAIKTTRSSHVETVVMLSHKKPDSVINVKVEFGEGEGKVPLDNIAKRAEAYKPKERVTYKMIKEYIEAKYGFKVHTAYIAEVKRELGLPMYDAPNAVEELKQPRKHPTAEKVEAIKDALKHFEVI